MKVVPITLIMKQICFPPFVSVGKTRKQKNSATVIKIDGR